MTEEQIDAMTFKELIIELKSRNNCSVDAEHFIVRDLKSWVASQQNFVDNLIINGKDPKQNESAIRIKTMCKQLLFAMESEKNVYPAGVLPPMRIGSIYPLQD